MPGVRLLSLDGAEPGTGGMTQLVGLQEIMERAGFDEGLDETPPPHKYFELIGGSGMGGLFAIFFAVWQLSVKEAIEVYSILHGRVFSNESWRNHQTSAADHLLEDTIREIGKQFSKGVDESLVGQTADSCRGFTCVINPDNMTYPRLFHTYRVRSNKAPECSVLDALTVSIAGPPNTSPVSIGNPPEVFISGYRRIANPSLDVLNEAKSCFGASSSIACLVSLGSGRQVPSIISSAATTSQDTQSESSKDTEQIHRELERRCSGRDNLYFRLDVSQGFDNGGSRSTSTAVTHTKQYLSEEKITSRIDCLVKVLRERPESASLDEMTSVAGQGNEGMYTTKPQLPPKPIRLFGRDQEVQIIVEILLRPSPARVAILGLGGIGKTSVALTVLHRAEIASRYSDRYFVACEGVTTVELLLNAVADVLRIPPSRRDVNLMDMVKRRLSDRPSILCLDNFETPWDPPSTRPDIESCLAQLAESSITAMIITMRGAQRPAQSQIEWSKPYLEQLRPLEEDPSAHLFEDIAGTELDEFTHKLLDAVDGIPLAITLLAHLVLDRFESTEVLWNRWCSERTAIIENGGDDKLSRLDTSIALSVNSPRLTSSARRTLHMLAILPDGLNTSDDLLEELQHRLPDISLRQELLSLQRTALLGPSSSSMQARYIMLEPIRQYILQNIHINNNVRPNLVQTYVNIMIERWDPTTSSCRSIILPDFLNIRAVLVYGFSERADVKDIVKAAWRYTDWASYYNIYSEEIIQMAMSHPSLTQNEGVDCLLTLGETQYWKNDFDSAEESYQRALSLSVEAQYIAGEAEARHKIGQLQIRRFDFGGAKQSFERALMLHTEVQDVLGKANDLHSLGEVRMRRDDLDGAEHFLKEALRLHTEAQDVLGQANDLRRIGELQMRRDGLDGAEHSLRKALRLNTEAQSVFGQANDLQDLGEVQMRRDDLDGAQHSLKEALRLHTEAQSVLGQADDLRRIGEVQMRRDDLDGAEHSLNEALRLHTEAQSVLGQANDLQDLGEVQMCRDDLDGAENSLKEALRLHIEVQDVLGQANDLRSIGELRILQDDLDGAEHSLKEALRLHTEAQSILGQANDHHSLGEMQMRGDNLDGAEQSFKAAYRLYGDAHNFQWQGYSLEDLEEVQRQKGDLDGAETTFGEARRLHTEVQDVKTSKTVALSRQSEKPKGFVRKLKVLFGKRRASKSTESNK